MSKSKDRKKYVRPRIREGTMVIEIFIMMLVSLGLIFLISFVNNKFREYDELENSMLFIHENEDYVINDELTREILKFRPDACKLIELYDEDFKAVFKLEFTDEETKSEFDELENYPELIKMFETEDYGHTSFEIDDMKEDIIFEWTESIDGKRYLLIVYMLRPSIKNLWIFSLVCYTIIILMFTLIIRMIFRENKLYIQHYETLSKM